MARGGSRANAGRKKGAATKKTREIADRAAESGITPLEYLLDVMRQPEPKPEKDEDGSLFAARYIGWRDRAFDAAKAAAPYVHPKLMTQTVKGAGDNGEHRHTVEWTVVDPQTKRTA